MWPNGNRISFFCFLYTQDELAGGVGEAHGFGATGDDEDGGDGEDFLQLKAPGKKDRGKSDGKEASKKGKEGEKLKRGQQSTGSVDKANEEGEQEEGAEQKETLAPGGKRILGLSKKDELLRRKELLGPAGSSNSLAAALTSTCAKRAGALLRTAHAADVVVEVARGGAQVCFLYALLLAGSEPGSGGECARQLAQALWQRALQGQCQRWVGTHAEKVLAALLHCGCEDVAKQAASELARALPTHEDPVAWSERFVHTTLLKDKQEGGKVATKGKGKGKHQQQQQQQQQQLLAPKAGKQKGEVAAGSTEAGSQKVGAAAATLPENLQGEATQQQQEQESPVGSPEVGKKRSRPEQASTPGQGKAAGGPAPGGSAAKSTSKKKKKPSNG
ncbi:hypothetical protein DUNSADRAFT_16686 [Dunaliella salina]|uniref:Uncharacterized protein n=1 Tax=Dunaliella salina TaxID=3046 RepID=A0ABQ7H0T4_DUNSA|nr:hypothetical protein DUNSADRAFT_16686 [Dunaliella salina]|eukprot:KAF5840452.1 hypothetical protein DUNSADRAFT_16686 [Dunaliella salina]